MPITKTTYKCDICGEEFDEFCDAEDCEQDCKRRENGGNESADEDENPITKKRTAYFILKND